ncbi:MAG: hypothetical protein EOM20_04685 [Spartobacteria bacterium]|nr:hypothetical protein [Spartobacteria bacterium]
MVRWARRVNQARKTGCMMKKMVLMSGVTGLLVVSTALVHAASLTEMRVIDCDISRGVSMYTDSTFAYVTDAGARKLRICRFSDLDANEIEVGNVSISGIPVDVITRNYQGGTIYAFVLNSTGVVHAVNVTDPAHPVVEASIKLPNVNIALKIEPCGYSQKACVACWHDGIRLLDVADPLHMKVMGAYENGYYFTDVAVLDRYVYAGAGLEGFLVLDINDPSNIVVRAARTALHYVNAVAVCPPHLWQKAPYVAVGDGTAGVRLYTLAPDNPMYLGTFAVSGMVMDVAMQADCMVVADDLGVRSVSISDPFAPRLLATFTAAVSRVTVAGRLICATGSDIHFVRMKTTPWDVEGDGRANIAVCDLARELAYIRNADGTLFEDAPYALLGSGGWPQSVDNRGLGHIDLQANYTGDGGWWWPTYGAATYTSWGWGGTLPVAGDYDYDRFRDVAVYYPETGDWYIHLSSSNTLAGGCGLPWGSPAETPVPGDYTGDGINDIVTYNPGTGNWNLWFFDPHFRPSVIIPTMQINWGWSDAVPVPADYDGDQKTDIAVYHPATGNWYIRYSTGGTGVMNWGWSEALPVPADYDGDGRDDVAVFHPAPGMWYLNYSGGGGAEIQWGWTGARPLFEQYWINRACGLLP